MQWYKIEFLKDSDPYGNEIGKINQALSIIFEKLPNPNNIALYMKWEGKKPTDITNDIVSNDKTYYLCLPEKLTPVILPFFKIYKPTLCEKPQPKEVIFFAGHNDPQNFAD